ncbi:MAG: TlpA family protein disulfide reductase [Caldisericaceae bacterium]|nr:TlpA family protein disulfide reductase [Caldisericaceae bacterium]
MKKAVLILVLTVFSLGFSHDWLTQIKGQIEQCQNLKQVDSLLQVFEQQLQKEPQKLLQFYTSLMSMAYKVREREIRTLPKDDQEKMITLVKKIEQHYSRLGNMVTTRAAELCKKIDKDSLDEELRGFCKGFEFYEKLLRFQKELRSKPRPDFSFVDVNGKKHRLYDFKGKYVLLHFWNLHSSPCIEEAPYLSQAQEKYGPKGLVIINIHVTVGHPDEQWEQEALLNFVQETEMPGIQVAGKQALQIKEQYFVRNFPTLFLLNPEGYVIKPEPGTRRSASELQGANLLKALAEVIK